MMPTFMSKFLPNCGRAEYRLPEQSGQQCRGSGGHAGAAKSCGFFAGKRAWNWIGFQLVPPQKGAKSEPRSGNAMTQSEAWTIVIGLWLVFAFYFAIAALRTKRTKTREPRRQGLTHRVVMLAAFFALFARAPRLGPLDARFVLATPGVSALGVALVLAGICLALWARLALGTIWSSSVEIKQGHQLIQSGPYQWIRHPLYSGMLLAAAGTALVRGEWRGVIAVGVALIALLAKARREEALLEKEFGSAFAAHRERTGLLLPRLGRTTASRD
jgi:protein-S-isoprenylcysteine O-methyltransferase Ste14